MVNTEKQHPGRLPRYQTAGIPDNIDRWASGPFLDALKKYALDRRAPVPNTISQALLLVMIIAAGVLGVAVPADVLMHALAACKAAPGRKPRNADLDAAAQPDLFGAPTVAPSAAPAPPKRPWTWYPMTVLSLGTTVVTCPVSGGVARLDLHGKRALGSIVSAAVRAGWDVDTTVTQRGLAGVRFVPPLEHVPRDGSFYSSTTEAHPEEPPPPSPRSYREGSRPLDTAATGAAQALDTIPPSASDVDADDDAHEGSRAPTEVSRANDAPVCDDCDCWAVATVNDPSIGKFCDNHALIAAHDRGFVAHPDEFGGEDSSRAFAAITVHIPDVCPCGMPLPRHLADLMNDDPRCEHVCVCERKYVVRGGEFVCTWSEPNPFAGGKAGAA